MSLAAPLVAVLDDEPEMRKALRRLLSTHGYRVEEYERGEDLLAAFDSHPIDCLLLDLHMPVQSGFGVLEVLHDRHDPLPTIVLTAHNEPGVLERLHVLGAQELLNKPVDGNVLFAAVERATSSRKQSWQAPPSVTRSGPET